MQDDIFKITHVLFSCWGNFEKNVEGGDKYCGGNTRSKRVEGQEPKGLSHSSRTRRYTIVATVLNLDTLGGAVGIQTQDKAMQHDGAMTF